MLEKKFLLAAPEGKLPISLSSSDSCFLFLQQLTSHKQDLFFWLDKKDFTLIISIPI